MVTALYQTFILGGHIKRELVLCEGGSCCLRREWLKNHISQLHKSRLQNSQVLTYWLVASYLSNIYWATKEHCGASQRAFVVKKKKKKNKKQKKQNLPVKARSGIFPRGGNGNQLHYSCLENSMDRGAWWAIVHGATEMVITERLSKEHCKTTPSPVNTHLGTSLVV